jgi:hypothetical protein
MRTIRNERDRKELVTRLNKLVGNETPIWGRMNVEQMMSHLVQACEMPFQPIVPDRSSFFSRTVIKPLILYVLPMPKEVKVSRELDQQADGRKPTGFNADRQRVIEEIGRIAELSPDHPCLGHHPFFGRMTFKEWAVIAYKHTDHHLRQFGV